MKSDKFRPVPDADIPVPNAEVIRRVRGRVLPTPRCEDPRRKMTEDQLVKKKIILVPGYLVVFNT